MNQILQSLMGFVGRDHSWNFCLWRTNFCLCGEMSAWFIGGNVRTSENTELQNRTETVGLNYAYFTLPPAFILVLNQCIKYQAKNELFSE